MNTEQIALGLLLQLLTVYCSVGASLNCTPSICKLRFELADEIHLLRGYRGCEDVYNFDCICNTTVDVQFIEHPPYIYIDPATKNVVGLLPGILKQALSVCCNKCTSIRYLKPYKTTTEALIMFMSSTVLLPFVTYSNAKKAVGDIFIATIPTKGVVYITSEEISMKHFNKFATSISSNWPLFCISLLLAIDAGIIVWILDCGRNGDEFPQDFFHGFWEGLWWAYVSMTTVGYGDKTPKTLAARAFGIVWITVGISLSGIFTASLITGMTQSLNDGPINIEGKTVGILNATRYELTIAMREGAEIKGFATYPELIEEMKSGRLNGILMDILVMKYYWTDLKKDIPALHYRLNAFANSETSFGILFSQSEDNKTNHALGKFLENFFLENRDNIDVIIKMAEKDVTRPLAKGLEAGIYDTTKSIFNAPDIYKLLFKYIGITTLILFVVGFTFEKIKNYLKVYLNKRGERKCSQLGSVSDKSLYTGETKTAIDHTTVLLRARFVREMKELEKTGHTDAKIVKDRVLSRVFHFKDINGCYENEVKTDDMQMNSEV